MSKDTIYRQDAIDAIFGRSHEIIKMRIGNLPSAQPKTGKWKPCDVPWYQCSECGAVRKQETFMENFCPNCGAKMIEPQESEE